MSAGLNDKLLWALTPEARAFVQRMEAGGIDRDLALSLLEQLVPETDIYELPVDMDDSSDENSNGPDEAA